MKARRIVFIISSAVALAACQPAGEGIPVDIPAEEQSIRDIEMRWLDLARAKDAASAAALFAADAVMFRPNREPVVGADAIEELLAQEYENTHPDAVLSSVIDRVEVAASGDLAFEYGTFTTTGGGPEGTENFRGKYLTVFRKIDGAWKIVADMSLSTEPAEASM